MSEPPEWLWEDDFDAYETAIRDNTCHVRDIRPRQLRIAAATQLLLNSAVKAVPVRRRAAFLRAYGLTASEIDAALRAVAASATGSAAVEAMNDVDTFLTREYPEAAATAVPASSRSAVRAAALVAQRVRDSSAAMLPSSNDPPPSTTLLNLSDPAVFSDERVAEVFAFITPYFPYAADAVSAQAWRDSICPTTNESATTASTMGIAVALVDDHEAAFLGRPDSSMGHASPAGRGSASKGGSALSPGSKGSFTSSDGSPQALVGAVVFEYYHVAHAMYIHYLAVHPRFRRRGVGDDLVQFSKQLVVKIVAGAVVRVRQPSVHPRTSCSPLSRAPPSMSTDWMGCTSPVSGSIVLPPSVSVEAPPSTPPYDRVVRFLRSRVRTTKLTSVWPYSVEDLALLVPVEEVDEAVALEARYGVAIYDVMPVFAEVYAHGVTDGVMDTERRQTAVSHLGFGALGIDYVQPPLREGLTACQDLVLCALLSAELPWLPKATAVDESSVALAAEGQAQEGQDKSVLNIFLRPSSSARASKNSRVGSAAAERGGGEKMNVLHSGGGRDGGGRKDSVQVHDNTQGLGVTLGNGRGEVAGDSHASSMSIVDGPGVASTGRPTRRSSVRSPFSAPSVYSTSASSPLGASYPSASAAESFPRDVPQGYCVPRVLVRLFVLEYAFRSLESFEFVGKEAVLAFAPPQIVRALTTPDLDAGAPAAKGDDDVYVSSEDDLVGDDVRKSFSSSRKVLTDASVAAAASSAGAPLVPTPRADPAADTLASRRRFRAVASPKVFGRASPRVAVDCPPAPWWTKIDAAIRAGPPLLFPDKTTPWPRKGAAAPAPAAGTRLLPQVDAHAERVIMSVVASTFPSRHAEPLD